MEDRLQGAGFLRLAVQQPPPWPDPERDGRVRRLRSELEGLGPVFARLGLYLATRLDLLPAEDCRTLAAIPDRTPPMPEPEVQERLRAELGGEGLAPLGQLDAAPVESRIMSQTHRARLVDGRLVAVRLARAGLLDEPDLGLLTRLAPRLSNLGWPLAAVRRILADFREAFERELDLRRSAGVLEQLGGAEAESRPFGAPRVLTALSTSRVLTLELPPAGPVFPGSPPGAEPGAEELARTRAVADLWMYLVFTRSRIPEDLSPADVRLAPGGTVQLVGGLFQPLASDDATALWRYLGAAARDDPGGVFAAVRELSTAAVGARPEELRHQLHHVVPRRDGRFGGVPPGFPELLLTHWRELERHGLTPGPALLAFFRGLVRLRELAGGGLSHGVLRESLQVTQISRGAEQMRRALGPAQLVRSLESLFETLTDVPRWLARRGERPGAPAPREPGREQADSHGSGWATLAAGLLLALSLGIWFLRLPTLAGSWTPAVEAVAVALVGLGLLRAAWRS